MYLRHNGTQEFLGDLRYISQSTVSRIVTTLAPIVTSVLEEFVPTAQEAIEMVNGRVCLVDSTITPCWSYGHHDELWGRKHGTTGFNAQLICLLDGRASYVSDPLPGRTHDAKAFTTTPVAEIVGKSGGGIGDKGYQSWRIFHTDYRRPYSTYRDAYDAARGPVSFPANAVSGAHDSRPLTVGRGRLSYQERRRVGDG